MARLRGVWMLADTTRLTADAHAGVPDVVSAGERAVGEYHCADCGYGVTVRRELPVCPMCGGAIWEAASWSPPSGALH
jgi:rubrerythrin